MATFYKYKDRDDITKSMIDWSGITKDISDNLMKEKDRRDTLKAKIEEDQLEKLKAIDAYAKGTDLTMNQSMLKVAQNYKDYLLNSHKLMKQGLVSVADTKIQKQGAMDTFNGINDAVKGYNEKIGAIAEAGGTLNDYLASNIARALDISKSQLVIDKMGRGSFVTMDEEGNEIIVPATSLGTILNKKFNRFDTATEVVNVVKGLGDWTIAEGGYRSVSDLRQRDEYETILNGKVNSILNSEDRVVEAASDMMGMKITQDKNLYESEPDKYILSEMKGNKIKLSANKEAVSKHLYNQIDAAIGRTETEKPRPVTRSTAGDIRAKKDKESTFNTIISALQGNEQKYKTVFDPYENISIPSLESGILEIPGKNPIELKTESGMNTIGNTGGRMAAQLGFTADEFEEYARNKGVDISSVSEKVLKYGGFKNAQPVNINTPLTKKGDTAESLLSTMWSEKVDVFNINEEGIVSDLTNILSNVASKAGLDSGGLFEVSLPNNDTIRIKVGSTIIDIPDDADINTYRSKLDEAIKIVNKSKSINQAP